MKFNQRFKVRLQFSLHDWWMGLHWKQYGHVFQVWICLLPCVAIHFTWEGQIDLASANSNCKRCHGTGIMGRKQRVGMKPMRLVCECVAKATIKRDALRQAKGFVKAG